jgi:hypothetical protein
MENQQLVVPDGDDIDIIIRPRMKTDEQGGTSNQVIALFVGSGAATYDNIVVRARGGESSNDLTMSDQDGTGEGEVFVGAETVTDNSNSNSSITGNKNISVLSKITSITNANPDANGTSVPTGITAIGQFKFTAAAHGNSKNGDNDVVLSGVVFNVNATNVSILGTSIRLYNKADQTKVGDCGVYNGTTPASDVTGNASGSLLVECKGLKASNVDTEIDEGTDTTLVLEADITNPNNASAAGGVSVLQVSIQNFDDIASTPFGALGGSARSHVQWIDEDQTSTYANGNVFLWVEYPETSVKSTSYNS